MDQRQTYNQQLIQWASVYARAQDVAETEAFRQVHTIVRDMESQKIAKPIIFYQIMMTLQALTCVSKIYFTEPKIKKILAIMYPDEAYVSDLTKQVISAIGISVATVQMNPANEAVLEQVRQSQAAQQPPQPHVYQPNIGMPGPFRHSVHYPQQREPSGAANFSKLPYAQQQLYGPPPGPYA